MIAMGLKSWEDAEVCTMERKERAVTWMEDREYMEHVGCSGESSESRTTPHRELHSQTDIRPRINKV